MELATIADNIQRHAEVNYGRSGWDVIVECYTKEEIVELLERSNVTSLEEGMQIFSGIAEAQDERRKEQINEIF